MGVIDEMRAVGDLVKKMGDVDLYRRIAKLEGEVIDLTRENRRLEQRAEELENALKFKETLTFDAPFYWLGKDSTPFCTACWEDRRKAAHLVLVYSGEGETRLNCPTCGHIYDIESIPWGNVSRKHR
jgi:hypothetical protein